MREYLALFAAAALAGTLYSPPASATPMLGSAQSFAVLGNTAVTNAGATTIYGHLGVTPGTSVTGFNPDGIVSAGTIHLNDEAAQLAMADATTAYNTLAGVPFTYDYTGIVLGSPGYTTLTPGVYHFNGAAQLTGTLTLDFLGTPNAAFVFQIGSTLTTASGASVNVINGNYGSGVYWQVGTSATLGTDTTFAGNILAHASATLDSTATILSGRAFALTGGVTLIGNTVSNNGPAEDFGSYGFSGGTGVPPTVTNRDPAPGSTLVADSDITVDVTFSQTVTGVDTTDMVLRGTAAAGAGVGAPSSLGGNVWQFPITGLVAGQLDIRLAPDSNGIKDLAGNDLAEVDWSYTIIFPVISVTLDSNSWAIGTISPGSRRQTTATLRKTSQLLGATPPTDGCLAARSGLTHSRSRRIWETMVRLRPR
jgi:type VI secretion system secreted protein VgrG